MKAKEVLRQYAAGERDFRNANLRGANLRGKDLSGADFSGADIRSANFANATLWGANFTKAQGGLQRRWLGVQLLLVTVIAGVSGVLQGFAGAIGTYLLDGTTEGAVGFGVYVLLVIVVYVA
ncbi:MAG: pentapeptide repeat-containing protein, partial [Phormidesmis sp.]